MEINKQFKKHITTGATAKSDVPARASSVAFPKLKPVSGALLLSQLRDAAKPQIARSTIRKEVGEVAQMVNGVDFAAKKKQNGEHNGHNGDIALF